MLTLFKVITITLLNFTFFSGLSTDLIYPNGISCTLPVDAQQKMINTIAGLENASMACPGTLLRWLYTCSSKENPIL